MKSFWLSFLKHPGPAAMMSAAAEWRHRQMLQEVQQHLTRLALINRTAVITIEIRVTEVSA